MRSSKFETNGKRQLRAIRGILEPLGGLNPVAIFLVLFLTTTFSFVGSGLYDALSYGVSVAFGTREHLAPLFVAFVFLLLVLILISILRSLVKGVGSNERPLVGEWQSEPVKVLIVSLSMPPNRYTPVIGEEAEKRIEAFKAGTTNEGVPTEIDGSHPGDPLYAEKQMMALRARILAEYLPHKLRLSYSGENTGEDQNATRFEGSKHWKKASWRMPLEAIAHQLRQGEPKLKHIIIVPSADIIVPTADGDRDIPGTFCVARYFKEVVETLLKREKNAKDIKISLLHEVEGLSEALKGSASFDDDDISVERGLSFGSLDQCIWTYQALFKCLKEKSSQRYPLRDRDILVDATGGLALNSIAAVAFATLARDRAFQYVDTNTYSVKTFDVYHDIETL